MYFEMQYQMILHNKIDNRKLFIVIIFFNLLLYTDEIKCLVCMKIIFIIFYLAEL